MSNSPIYEEIAKEIEGVKEIVRKSDSEIRIRFWDGNILHIQSGANNLNIKLDRWQKRKLCFTCHEELKTETEIDIGICDECCHESDIEVAQEEC